MAETTSPAFFVEPKPASIRLWHWLTAIFIFGSLITVVFGSTLFRTRNNVQMVQEQVERKGGTVTVDQARSVAHEYSDKLWMLHKYIGYGVALLLLWRIIIEFSLSSEKRLRARIKYAMRLPADPEQRHFLWVQYGYSIFYILIIVMGLTGLVLAFEDQQWLDPIHDFSKETHEITQYGLYAYFAFHIVGVIRADVTKYGGIISRMINGRA
jgi:cytochrome b561